MIPNYSMIPAIHDPQLFDDPQPFDDPQLFDDQLEVWTSIIKKSTVIPSSPMVLFASKITIIELRSRPIPREQTNPFKIGRQIDPNQGIWLLKLDHHRRGASLSSIGHVFKLIQ